MPRPRTIRRAGVGLVALVSSVLVGCGDDEPTAGESVTTTTTEAAAGDASTTTAGPTTTTAPDEPTTTGLDGEGISELESLAAELLVASGELGIPAEDQGYTPAGAAPCGFDLDTEHPSDVQVGTRLLAAGGSFEEVLRVYTDTDAADGAYEAMAANETACSFAGRVVSEPVDVNDRVGADAAVRFSVSDGSGETVRIVTRVADAVVVFSLSSPPGAPIDPATLDPIDVAAFGVGKILAALEA